MNGSGMFIEMTCSCMATFQVNAGSNEIVIMSWAQRFIDGHQSCGYMAPFNTDVSEKTKRINYNLAEGL